MENISQGSLANNSGRIAEKTIIHVLECHGINVNRQVTIGSNIYNHPMKIDCVAYGFGRYPNGLAIESKWQSSSGSVDEKFPYLVLNIKERYIIPTIIVVHGGACRQGAIDWLRTQIDGEKLIGVFRLEEFMKWISEEINR